MENTQTQILDISVLYVEDDPFIRKMMVSILSKHVREIHTAENGQEGLRLFKAIKPDVVLTDIRMPIMDGLEMSALIKTIERKTPIIVTTAYGDTENLLRAIEIGIDYYVLKPIDKNKLLSSLRRYAEEIALSKRLKDQEELTARTKALLMAAIEQSPLGIIVIDAPNGKIRIANPSAIAIRGKTDAKLIDIDITEQAKNWNFCHVDGRRYEYYELPQFLAISEGLTITDKEILIKRDSGEARWLIANAAPVKDNQNNIVAGILMLQDITERHRLTEQLQQAQKMEAVGQLTGGIAHDFNNILTAIIGYGNLIKNNMSKDDPNRPYLEQILNSAEKASTLTRSLLAFSRKQIISPKQVNLNEVILGMEKLLSRLIGEDIELKLELCPEAIYVFVDVGQIEQVVMNLATNARDAMPDGGTLTVSTSLSYLKERDLQDNRDDTIYALLKVTDTGIGMDEMTLKRIFEPFFTTKQNGKGTGLGLSMAYGIIKQHNGYIFASSECGKGTEFRIYLPLVKEHNECTTFHHTDSEIPISRGVETILLAEDNEDVRIITKEILTSNGYKVIEAIDGSDAVVKFLNHKDEVQLLLFDVIMPKKNGKEAYEEIKQTKPDIKIIFLSGYATEVLAKRNILGDGIDFISKPVSPKILLRKVREVLDNP